MQITIRGHHLTITPAIEKNIKEKFSQMTKHLDQVNSMQIKLAKDHQIDKRSHKGSANHIAEAIIRLPGVELFAQATADDIKVIIDEPNACHRYAARVIKGVKVGHLNGL